jgi:3-hydroxyacyl-CoA dehydrogenase
VTDAVHSAILDTEAGRIARLTIDFPPVNAGSTAMRAALMEALTALQGEDLGGIILTGASGNFVGGADIREFDQPAREPHLPEIIAAIEALPCPVVAAIDGAALGGGLELALGCDGRVATKRGAIGLPEVTLGLIPGAGGTLRLPRITGIAKAIDLIGSGRRIKSEEALALGIVDRVAEDDLEEAAIALITELSGKRRLRDLPAPEGDEAEIKKAEEAALKSARGSDAVPAAIAAIKDGATFDVDEALARERETSLTLRRGAQSKALRHLFFAERRAGKLAGDPEPRPVATIGIVGAGRMGQGIAIAAARAGYQVKLAERDDAALQAGLDAIAAEINRMAERGRLSSPEALISTITGCRPDAMGECDLVIEAIFEDMNAKKALFAELEKVLRPDAVIATNTSYLDIHAMAAGLADPSRVGGLHFFNPAHVMRLVEVIRGEKTAPDVLATLVAVAKKMRKLPVIAKNAEGFIGNRIFAAYRVQSEFLLEEGALPEGVDAAMRGFGMAMGPFSVFDLAGLDIAWAQRKRLAATRDPEARYVEIPDRLCEAGRFGRKTGKGWYDYSADKNGTSDPEVVRLIEEASAAKEFERRKLSEDQIVARLLAVMVNTACLLLAEGIAERPSDVDLALVNGYGFPKLKGGPLHWAANRPREEIRAEIEAMVKQSGHGYRVAPNLDDVLDATLEA